MDYAENRRVLAQMSGDSALESNSDFQSMLPACIASAELRIQRDLDLLSTRITDETGKLTQNRKTFVLPETVGTFLVIEELRVITPTVAGEAGIWGPPLLPASKITLDWLYPSEVAPSSPSIPIYWAPVDQATIHVAPPPDLDYLMSVFGTMRFFPLTPQTKGSTYISSQYRDLFLAAEMIFVSAFQRNWSARSDDPAMSKNWNEEYQYLLRAAGGEQARMKGLIKAPPSTPASP